MTITSIAEAFEAIEKQQKQVPFEAIEFLYEHEPSEQITEKIAFYLENAYNDAIIYDKQQDYYSPAPLWYAVVAENHLSEVLINPIIELYITGNGDSWDWLDEQGSFLIGKACAEIGRPAIKAFLDTIETFVKKNTELTVLYLHECIHFVDKEEDLPQILSILQHVDYKWMDSFATHLAQAQIKGALPKLQEILKYYKNKSTEFLDTFTIAELEEAIQELETGISPVADSIFPFYQNRSNWKEAYKYFYREKDDDFMPPPAPAKKKKIGRNDPCPCGSGKKFKKCCIKLYS